MAFVGSLLLYTLLIFLIALQSVLQHLKVPLLIPRVMPALSSLTCWIVALTGERDDFHSSPQDLGPVQSYDQAAAFGTAYLVESIFESIPQLVLQVLYTRHAGGEFDAITIASLTFS